MSRTKRISRSRWLIVLAWLACSLAGHSVGAQQVEPVAPAEEPAGSSAEQEQAAPEEQNKFLRLSYDDDEELVSMDTAIVRYVPANPDAKELSVDLVGVIHIAERDYYEKMNEQLDKYDVVLYELVAPEGTEIPEGGGKPSFHPLRMLQDGMRDMLKLESQLAHIDYTREHFVHADMSPEQFSESMKDRGENFFTMFSKMMSRTMAREAKKPSRGSDLSFLLAMFDRNRSHMLKRMMAEQFGDLESIMEVFEGPDGSTIISERNKVAMKVLSEQIDAGKKRIAIFYGAGHMMDMEKRLEAEFGLKRQSEKWLQAWDLRDKRKQQPESADETDDATPEEDGEQDGAEARDRKPAEVGQP